MVLNVIAEGDVMGLQPFKLFNSFSAGTDIRRHNLTSDSDLYSRSRTERIKIFIIVITYMYSNEELTETFQIEKKL